MDDKQPLIRCPHCGNTNEFFMRYSYKDVTSVLDNQGDCIEENFDNAYIEGGKIIFCAECRKQVMRRKSLDKLKQRSS